jgi:ethanolamine utilization microcompartment shell protein EutL
VGQAFVGLVTAASDRAYIIAVEDGGFRASVPFALARDAAAVPPAIASIASDPVLAMRSGPDIVVARLSNGVWSQLGGPLDRLDGGTAFLSPALAVDHDGRPYVAYTAYRGHAVEMRVEVYR